MHLSLIIKNIEKLKYQLNFEKCKNISLKVIYLPWIIKNE